MQVWSSYSPALVSPARKSPKSPTRHSEPWQPGPANLCSSGAHPFPSHILITGHDELYFSNTTWAFLIWSFAHILYLKCPLLLFFLLGKTLFIFQDPGSGSPSQWSFLQAKPNTPSVVPGHFVHSCSKPFSGRITDRFMLTNSCKGRTRSESSFCTKHKHKAIHAQYTFRRINWTSYFSLFILQMGKLWGLEWKWLAMVILCI